MNQSTRTYHDPLHKSISLNKEDPSEKLIIKLIDTPAFQRLRRIKQLGPAYLTFHGAESSRFTHSLGAFYIARKALNKLEIIDKSLKEKRGILYSASLLHDLGHAPMSHTGEDIFGIQHEQWSSKIILEDPTIHKILEGFAPGTSTQIANILTGENKSSNVINSLISSQLDCDRLDYLLRDSYSTGTNYGQLDLERILSALTIAPDGDIAIHPKGLMAVEHYLIVRSLMYRGVYNHRINEVCNWILEKLIKTIRLLGSEKIWADEIMAEWLWNAREMSLYTFLENDDIRTNYHIARWLKESPKEVKRLCERFLNRKLLKAENISHLSNEKKLELLAKARVLSSKYSIDPDFSCGLRNHNHSGYEPYKSGLRLWDGKQLQALEKCSSLIRSLIKPSDLSWLIYPREIDTEVQNLISSMK
tara:strand:+ start:59 stop:1312 length:1254 start_codon:yes stop_codon:yes gene_type:complete